jgi:formamidopyrimidine-DNA glycosylase
MPELPEVEVTKQGIEPFIQGKAITGVRIHDGRLRWPVPKNLEKILLGQKVAQIKRRGKYLLFRMDEGHLIIHLGMTGVLRLLKPNDELKKHDRVEILFGKQVLRLHDPRKFGAVLWASDESGEIEKHPLIAKLGVEPFSEEFNEECAGQHLFRHAKGRQIAIKQWLLAGQAVVGVGNIYCSESLFSAGIHPEMPAGKLTLPRAKKLAIAIKETLSKAIKAGGSSLKDFVDSHGDPGHFMLQTKVYDRATLPCRVCKNPVKQIVQGQRSTYFCSTCQKK